MSYTKQQKPTSIKEWRNNSSKLVTLPSGNVMKLKRVALAELIGLGRIPDTLTGLAVTLINKSTTLTAEQLKEYVEIVNIVVMAAADEPKVARTASDNTLGIDEIDWVDRVQIFSWGNGAASSLRPFR